MLVPSSETDKRAYFTEQLQKGGAFLHIDSRRPGVRVPDAFAEDSHLVLQYGLAMKIDRARKATL